MGILGRKAFSLRNRKCPRQSGYCQGAVRASMSHCFSPSLKSTRTPHSIQAVSSSFFPMPRTREDFWRHWELYTFEGKKFARCNFCKQSQLEHTSKCRSHTSKCMTMHTTEDESPMQDDESSQRSDEFSSQPGPSSASSSISSVKRTIEEVTIEDEPGPSIRVQKKITGYMRNFTPKVAKRFKL